MTAGKAGKAPVALLGDDEIRERFGIPAYYTVRELSEMFGISTSTIYRDIDSGVLRVKIPKGAKRGFRICEDDIASWLRDRMEYVS